MVGNAPAAFVLTPASVVAPQQQQDQAFVPVRYKRP
jgi:hypothetical protein